ncbi:GUN4 domain-containing protein [Nostoc sp. TCL26-01]|uniref:GUN4 domain-containing protein n=1 Tax=Nostoc sp. TCL26-01 TaxID=2576904 RepID=UPI0015B7CD57|nr:GUN4 domain-containing protein [Nostoc sp. TCL26-01]QLE60005.1 GUN4 domain-containing protein [Nostoc sp. TCL26-01]
MYTRNYLEEQNYFLGQGYVYLLSQQRPQYVEYAGIQEEMRPFFYKKIYKGKNSNELQEQITQDANFAAQTSPNVSNFLLDLSIKIGAKLNSLNELTHKKNSTYLLVTALVEKSHHTIINPKLSSEAIQILQQPKGDEDFYRKAGDEYVYGFVHGCYFNAIFEITGDSQSEINDISSILEVELNNSLSGSVTEERKKVLRKSQNNLKLEIIQRGLNISTEIDITDINSVIEYVKKIDGYDTSAYSPIKVIFNKYKDSLIVANNIIFFDTDPFIKKFNLKKAEIEKLFNFVKESEKKLENARLYFKSFNEEMKFRQNINIIKKFLNEQAPVILNNLANCQIDQTPLPDLGNLNLIRIPQINLVISSLPSKRNINYSRLDTLLYEGKWKEADQETFRIMLILAKSQESGYITSSRIYEIPCEDLNIIDTLWKHYSNNRFGFSVQKSIWDNLKIVDPSQEKLSIFGDQVGWRRSGHWLSYENLDFSSFLKLGFLPIGKLVGDYDKHGELNNSSYYNNKFFGYWGYRSSSTTTTGMTYTHYEYSPMPDKLHKCKIQL